MRKIIALVLTLIISLSLVTTSPSPRGNVYARDYDISQDDAEPYFDSPYYDFVNPIKIATNDDYIAVIEGKTENSAGAVVVFEKDGTYLGKKEFSDPRDVAIYKNGAVVLDYNLENNSTMVHSLSFTDFESYPLLKDDVTYIFYDLEIVDNFLYIVEGGLVRKLVRYGISGYSSITLGVKSDGPSEFNNSVLINGDHTALLGLTMSNEIFYKKNSTADTVKISGQPNEKILDLTASGENIFLLTEKGIYQKISTQSGSFNLILGIETATSNLKNIINTTSITTWKEKDQVKLLALDGAGAMSAKKFTFTGGVLVPDNFAIQSFSASEEGLNTPTSISASYKDIVIADSKNNRVQIINEKGRIVNHTLKSSDGKVVTPTQAGVDFSGNIYVFTSKKTFNVYTSSGNLIKEFKSFDGSNFRTVEAFYVSDLENVAYFLDGSKLMKYDHAKGELEIAIPYVSSGKDIFIDYYNNFLISTNGLRIDIYHLGTGEKFDTISNYSGQIEAVAADLEGSVYSLYTNGSYSYIAKHSIIEGKFVKVGQSQIISDVTFVDFDINHEENEILLLPKNQHRFFLSTTIYRSLDVTNSFKIKVPEDIFNQKQDKDVVIATVKDNKSGLIIPLNSRDELYPNGYAILRPMALDQGAKVIVTSYTEDKKYAYVLYGNAVGFMLKENLDTGNQNHNTPFEFGISLHENSYIYKYPLTTVYEYKPLYSIHVLDKGLTLEVIDMANDYVSPGGLMWYRVKLAGGDDEIVGYIPRYNIVPNSAIENPNYEEARINTNLLEGYLEVYADKGQTPLGNRLYDGTRVNVIEVSGDYAYVREIKNSNAIEGWVVKNGLTSHAQTTSITVAIILTAVLILVVAILIAVKISLSKKRRRRR